MVLQLLDFVWDDIIFLFFVFLGLVLLEHAHVETLLLIIVVISASIIIHLFLLAEVHVEALVQVPGKTDDEVVVVWRNSGDDNLSEFVAVDLLLCAGLELNESESLIDRHMLLFLVIVLAVVLYFLHCFDDALLFNL